LSERPSFLTAIESLEEMAPSSLATPKTLHTPAAPTPLEPMGRTCARGELGRIGRVHVLAHEVTHPSENLLQQDMIAYPKNQRPPAWDFEKSLDRPPLVKPDSMSEPGQYDVRWGCVERTPRSSVAFEKAEPRRLSAGALGHGALEGTLQPDSKRAPGGAVRDTSKAKDAVRARAVHVNDFARELERPSLAPPAHHHDASDPVACEAVLSRELSFDAKRAEEVVRNRHDLAPDFSTMLSRGRHAVQGVRALQEDRGVRGAVGLGFDKSTGSEDSAASQAKQKGPSSSQERPDPGPRFDAQTLFQQTNTQNNFVRGRPPLYGAGHMYDRKWSALRKKPTTIHFKRTAPQGFTGHSKLGGPLVTRQNRTYEALPTWTADALDETPEPTSET